MTAVTTQGLLEAASAALTQQRPLLDSIYEINLRFLQAVCSAATTTRYGVDPDLGVAAPLLRCLGADDLDGVSRFPFLLLDLGLSSADAVATLTNRYESIQDRDLHPDHPAHLALARTALVAGWYAARTDPCGALLLFGFSPAVLTEVASMAIHRVEALAPLCVSPLTLRWRTNPSLWDELLHPGAHTSVDTVRRFVMHAVQLTATSHLK